MTMLARDPFEQCPSEQIDKSAPILLVKALQSEHDGPMGEKPLSIDDAPAQASTIGAPGPLGGVDTPPPGMAAGGINTTRSNIKNSGAVAAPPPVDGGGGGSADGETEDPLPPEARAAGIITTRSNIKHGGSVAAGGSGSAATDTDGPSDPSGLATEENGIKHGDAGGAADGTSEASIGPDRTGPTDPGDPFPADPGPAGGAGSIAGGVGEPIPGIDGIRIKRPSGAAAGTGPVMPEPTRPADPFPAEGGPAGIAIKEQGVRYGEEAAGPIDSPEHGVGAATTTPGTAGAAVDGQNMGFGMETMGAARAGEPIPDIDVKLGKNPGGLGNSGWHPSPDPGPGPSPDRKPIPGIDDAAEKKKA